MSMKHTKVLASIAVATLAFSAFAQETVKFSLVSPQAGGSVAPGSLVTWDITVQITTAGSQGLALVSVDLTQAAANPAKFDIPVANSVPALFAGFSRPAGISNPGEVNPTTGYVGVQRGTVGEKNLIQVGGGQNTFGAVGPAGIGQDITVDGNIGKTGAVIMASGSFLAPATNGSYTFTLANALANTLDQINVAPAFSPVSRANVDLTAASFTFSVAPQQNGCPGDSSCDNAIDFGDIDPFVAALSGEAAWLAFFGTPPTCDYIFVNDTNGDLAVDFGDIDAFVSLLSPGGPCP